MPKTVDVLGTTHNTEESIQRVEHVIRERAPDVVAVELPPETFREGPEWSLRAALDPRSSVTLPGLLLHRIALDGDMWQVDEMFVAAETAAEVGARIALIDRPHTESLDKNARALPNDLLGRIRTLRNEATVHRDRLAAGEHRELLERDLWTVGEAATPFIDYARALRRHGATNPLDAQQRQIASKQLSPEESVSLVDGMRSVLPRWFETHIDERDACMAGHLRWLADEETDVLAVMAKDHVSGVAERLNGRRELDASRVREPTYADGNTILENSSPP